LTKSYRILKKRAAAENFYRGGAEARRGRRKEDRMTGCDLKRGTKQKTVAVNKS
jgi:hypothetical protein